ncbi:MAG: hypothetical protein Q7T18_00470, partial [Sedimentisphaerales bacterium]|nr:hypothetical protein [Sedimentisphaerales bacterium]
FKTLFFFDEFEIRNSNISCIRILGFQWWMFGNTAEIDYTEDGKTDTYAFSARGSFNKLEKMFAEAGIKMHKG